MNSLLDDPSEVPQMSDGLLSNPVKPRPDSLGIGSIWDAITEKIAPIFNSTPIGYGVNALRNTTKDEYKSIGREMAEGFYSDLPQGTIDLGVDIVNATGGLLGIEDDVIDRDKAQIIPDLYSNDERARLNMKMNEEDSTARLMGQLLGGYAGIRSVASKGLMGEAIAVGGAGATLDPEQDNLSAMMKDTRFNNAVFEFLASGVDGEASAMERLQARAKTVAEELGLAFAPIGLMKGVQEIKNNPELKAQIMDTFSPDRVNSLLDNTVGLTGEPTFGIVQDNKTGLLQLVAQQSSESLPSTGKIEGRILAQMPLEIQQAHQAETNAILGTFVEDTVGLKIIDDVESPSYFEGHVGTSRQISYEVDTEIIDGIVVPTAESREKIKKASAILGYVQDQDAVTAHFMTPIKDISEADVVDIALGRVLSNDEMIGVVKILDDMGLDDIAPVTSGDGIHLLNVSDGAINNDMFREVSDKIGDYLGASDLNFGKNALKDDGYVGGFDGYQSGQEEYAKIASQFDDTGTSKSAQSWGSNSKAVETKLEEIRANTKDFIKRNPLEKKTIRQIGEDVDALAVSSGKVIKIGDYSKEANQTIFDRMLGEAQTILKGGDKEARGWYTIKFQKALDEMSKRHPELAQGVDQTARDLYSSIVAITSDGAKISENLRFADDVYQAYKQTGKVNLHIPAHTSSASFKGNLTLLQSVIDEKGLRGALDWLSETQTTKAIKDQYGINTGYLKDTQVPNSTIFGAKLGMFHANLMGQPNWLTMDRWWSRTFNRYRGQMTTQPTDSSIKAYRKAARIPMSVPDSEVIEMAHIQAKKYSDSGFKSKTNINIKANNVSKQIKGLRNDPQNASDRAFMMDVTERVAKELQKDYPDMTVADLQAILWYGEKYRMKQFGSRSPVDVHDYSDVTGGLLKKDASPQTTGLLK